MRFENWLYTLPLRLRSLFRRNHMNKDLNEELRDHVDRQIDANLDRGMSREEARLAALRSFGNLASLREETHDTWAWVSLEHLWQDFLYACRSLRRAPLLSAMAIIAVSLGIGLNAGVFSILNALFLRPPTLEDPHSFVRLYPRYAGWVTRADEYSSFTSEDFDAIRSDSRTLDVAASRQFPARFEEGNQPVFTLQVSCNYFHVMGIDHSLMGRFFEDSECNRGGASPVAVLTEPFWRTQLGADPQILGKTIRLSGIPVVVVGIVPPNFGDFLVGGVFLPYTLEPQFDPSRDLLASTDTPWLSIVGRLRRGFARAEAQAELSTIMSRQDRAYAERKVSAFNRKTSLVLTNGSFIENPGVHYLLLGLMSLILGPLMLIFLLACSNVTALFLSRTIARRGEIAMRLALGVPRSRLAGMLLVESLLIVSIGGVLSIVLAYRVPLLIMNIANPSLANSGVFLHPDWQVSLFLAILVVAATVISSLMPIRAAWNLDLVTTLKGNEGAVTVRSRTTNGLIVVQIALSFVLVCAAVLFAWIPSLIRNLNPGFETHHTVAVPLQVNTAPGNRAQAVVFYRTLESKILAIPGVQSLAYASLQPFNQAPASEIRLPGQAKGSGKQVAIDEVSNGFFSTFDIHALQGRLFLTADINSTAADAVAVISQAFAKQFWPGRNPLGEVIVLPDDRQVTVVGIVADTHQERFDLIDGPRLYTLRSPSDPGGNLFVRFTGSAKPVENAIRDIVKEMDPTESIAPRTIWEVLEANADSITSLERIILIMASIALLMAVIGVYGILSFSVNQRRREFGIKMVLGADRASIFRSVVVRAIKAIVIGLICGVGIAEPALLLFNRMLVNSPLPVHRLDRDLTVFSVSAVLLAMVSLIAVSLPASRAMRTDPIRVLRTE